MTRARSQLIDLDSTTYYHCISRCVRRAFLWGEDHLTGKDFSHRKQWVIHRLGELNQLFAIDVCAYAIMSNHYHVVLRVNTHKANQWTNEEVITRWSKLFSLPVLITRYLTGLCSDAEIHVVQDIIDKWRQRLMDISWFMRTLNEHLARKANKEDNCKGRFWEGRFKSQALLDEAAVLTCMSYVDLNPIRAGLAKTLEDSDFTSIQHRIRQWSSQAQKKTVDDASIDLLPLNGQPDPHDQAFTFSQQDYFQLVDWAGRVIREDKKGYIPAQVPPLLAKLNMEPEHYLQQMKPTNVKLCDYCVLGRFDRLKNYARKHSKQFIRNALPIRGLA